MSSIFSLDNDVFASLVFYGSLALGKTILMSLVTGFYRQKNKCMISIEDAKSMAPNNPEKQKRILQPNEAVARALEQSIKAYCTKALDLIVRRAHQNDLENIIPFALISLFYVSTRPSHSLAVWHFRTFLLFRICHTIVYLKEVRQPARFLMFCGGYITCISMLVQSITASYKYY